MNDRCPVCHVPVTSKNGRLVTNNGVPVLYCKECHETIWGEGK